VIFEVLGSLDELSSLLGLCRSKLGPGEVSELLRKVQVAILRAGVEAQAIRAGIEPRERIGEADVEELERVIDRFWPGPAGGFVLPSGSEAAAILHVARAVCRRAERALVRLVRERGANTKLLLYFNRLGDLLYALAMYVNRREGVEEDVAAP